MNHDFGLGRECIILVLLHAACTCVFSPLKHKDEGRACLVVLFGGTWGSVRDSLASERAGLRAGVGEGSKISSSSACCFSSSMYRAQSKISSSSSLRDTQILTHGAHWWMVEEHSPKFALILTGQGQNGYFRPLSSAVCAHPLPARSCSLKIGALQKAAIVPEDECCLMSIFWWRSIRSVNVRFYLSLFVRFEFPAVKEILKCLQLKVKRRTWASGPEHSGPERLWRVALPGEEAR